MQRHVLALIPLTLGAACSSLPPPVATPVPELLRPAVGEVALGTLTAQGVQIYECRARKDDAQSAEWVFVAPEASLTDAQGRPAGRHYAGPHWESLDGSKLLGSVKSRVDAPLAGAIPWLLLSTKSVGPAGALSKVSSIQRINTAGGVAPPADECSARSRGKEARVAYTADYVLLGGR
jgi:hypothetical protein